MNIEYKPKLQFLQKLNIWFFAFIQDILHWKMEKVGLENNSMIVIYDFFEQSLEKYMFIMIF